MLRSVRGVRLNVVDTGGDGSPVVLLHGIGGSGLDWGPQVQALRANHRVLLPDARGFGRSDRTYGAMTFADYAEDVVDLLDQMDVQRPVVVGLSLGGMIAQAVALAAPDRIGGLVLCDTSGALDAALADALVLAQGMVTTEGMGAVSSMFMPLLAGPGVTEATHPWFEAFAESFRGSDPLAFAVALGAIASLDHLDRLPAVEVSTLVIHGQEDALLSIAHAEALAAAIPGARLSVLEGVGHLSNLEAADRFNTELEGFLQTRSG